MIGEILRRLVPGARLHAVGIGSAPNRSLTRGAARAGRGVEILVGDDDDARAASRRLLQATVRPVLTDLEVGGPALVKLAPARPQDVLEGQPLILLAEIAATGGSLRIQGKQAGTPAAWQHRVEIPAAGESARTAVQAPGSPGCDDAAARGAVRQGGDRRRRAGIGGSPPRQGEGGVRETGSRPWDCVIGSPAGRRAWSPSRRTRPSTRRTRAGASGWRSKSRLKSRRKVQD